MRIQGEGVVGMKAVGSDIQPLLGKMKLWLSWELRHRRSIQPLTLFHFTDKMTPFD